LIVVRRYKSENKDLWNDFVSSAKNSTFLFNRDFMDYHKDRFEDYSLMCFDKGKLVAILPANIKDGVVYSHEGLSYGGLIFACLFKLSYSLVVFKKVLFFLNENNIRTLVYKKQPIIYQGLEGLQINSILHILEAKLYRSDVYLVIDSELYSINRNRKRAIRKSEQKGIILKENEFLDFWNKLLIPNLNYRFGVDPVHSIDEILSLKESFPNKINCYSAHYKSEIRAGVVIFEFNDLIHIQYSSASNNRNEDGAIDFLFDFIFKKYLNKKYLSIGSCSEGSGNRTINRGLLSWKESFGAISIPQEFYNINTVNFKLIDNTFS
jgi:hypothetical protein